MFYKGREGNKNNKYIFLKNQYLFTIVYKSNFIVIFKNCFNFTIISMNFGLFKRNIQYIYIIHMGIKITKLFLVENS